MTITTVRYVDNKIVLPKDIIDLEGIQPGDYVEIDIRKIIKTKREKLKKSKAKNKSEKNQTKKKFNQTPCPLCDSLNTVGHGSRTTKIGKKQKRHCRQCGKYYTVQDDSIKKMKNSKEVIEEALKLSENHSLRDTARQIKEKFNVQISHSAICVWRKKFKNQLLI